MGRKQELSELQERLKLFNQVLVLGAAGSGKNFLVRHYFQLEGLKQNQVIWLNFGLSKWPFIEGADDKSFENYFSDLYFRKLENVPYVVFDHVQKLNQGQFEFLKSFVEQVVSNQKFIFLSSENLNFFAPQIIQLQELEKEEAIELFQACFPKLELEKYLKHLQAQKFFPQDILFLPQNFKDREVQKKFEFSDDQKTMLNYLALIDKNFSEEELSRVFSAMDFSSTINLFREKFLIDRKIEDDAVLIVASPEFKKNHADSMSHSERVSTFKLHIKAVRQGLVSDAVYFRYLIRLQDYEGIVVYLTDTPLEQLNQINANDLQVLCDYLIKLSSLVSLSDSNKQKFIQLLMLAGQRDLSIQFAQMWLKEWHFEPEISEAARQLFYEIIYLLNRSDLHTLVEAPINFYLNRVDSKFRFLLRLELVITILRDDPKKAIQSLERILEEFNQQNSVLKTEEKRVLAHVYFQLGRAESISQNYEKCRQYYQYAESYYRDCGLNYYASISCLNFTWTYFSERNFSYLAESLNGLDSKYMKYGFLLTRFGAEILHTYYNFFGLNHDKLDLHLEKAKRLLRHDIPKKPKIDFFKLNCSIQNLKFNFAEAEKNYTLLCDHLADPEQIKIESIYVGCPQSLEDLIDFRFKPSGEQDFILLQLLLTGILSFEDLKMAEVDLLKKSQMGNVVLRFLEENQVLNYTNFSVLLKALKFSKTSYTNDEINQLSEFQKWSGYLSLKKFFFISQDAPTTITYSQDQTDQAQVDLLIDDVNREVFYKSHLKSEFSTKNMLYKLLKVLATTTPQFVSKESLALSVWGEEYDPTVHDNRIYTSMQRLRNSIGQSSIVQSEMGYRLNPKLSLKVVVPKASKNKLGKGTSSQVYELFISTHHAGKSRLTRKEIVEATQLSEATVKRILNELLNENLIERSGEGVKTFYALK